MAVKKIGFVEQHVEKLVAGIGGLALLGVLAWQFVGGRSTISLGKGNEVALSQAYARVADDANRLKGEMNSQTPPLPQMGESGSRGPLEVFTAKFTGPVAGRKVQLADAFEKYKVGPGIEIGTSTDGSVVVPVIPAVTTPTAHTFVATIASQDVQAHPALAAMLPAAEPFDKAAVSVEGRFDGTALLAALQAAPPAGQRGLPRGWWENQTAILRVELVRQEQKADGGWTDAATVPPAPGREALAARLGGVQPGADLTPLLTDAWAMEEAIQRPAWYERPVVGALTMGEVWQPPIEAITALESVSEGGRKPGAVQRELAAARTGLDRARKKLTDLRQGEGAPGGGRPAPGAAPPRGGGGGRPPQPGQPGGAGRAEVTVQERLVKDAEDRVKRLTDELAKMGVQTRGSAARTPTGAETNSARVFANDSIQVWAHDLSVERGKTYRYMVRVWATNPLFGKSNVGADQQALAAQPALPSTDSAWTDPVRVDDEVMFFFTGAQDRGEGNAALGRGAQASGELFKFSWGYWRRLAVPLQPGDAPSGEVRVPDIARIAAQGAEAGNAGGGAAGGGRDGAGAAGREPPKAVQEAALPTVGVKVSKDLVLLDAVPVMDVAAAVAGRGTPFAAYVREASGRLVMRLPEEERSSEVYRRLRNSANAGEEALAPNPELLAEERKRERDAKKAEDERNKPAKAPGGGGGGGRGGN
ncbi:MAG: hypothetical protein ACKVS8_00075 [Phycisphaerales bacterium]